MLKIMQLIIRRSSVKRIDNDRGAALVITLFALTILIGLTASFAISSVTGVNNANRYRNSAVAFWAAEAAINRFIQDTTMLDGGDQNLTIGSAAIALSKDDSDASKRVVTAVSTANGMTRTVEVEFPATPPDLFSNSISSGGNIMLDGAIAGVTANGQTRLSGIYDNNGFITTAIFEDKQEGVSNSLTTLGYPDANVNGTADEFDDFVAYNRAFADVDDPNFTGEYTADEVLHIQSNDTVNIWPSSELVGKKVIFVEGDSAGSGDVNIWFDSTWAADQDVTVVSTGSVNYVQPLQNPSANSQLNTISWDNYNEVAVLYSTHSGVTYTHGGANYGSIVSFSNTKGNLISNSTISLDLILVWKQFDYESPIDENGLVPPAFQGLIGTSSGGYASTPNVWRES